MMKEKNYTYILRCSDDSLYTGWTNNLTQRIDAHNNGKGAKYTRGRVPVKLVYFEAFNDKAKAMSREWEIKQLTREEKLQLITRRNQMRIITWNVNGLRASLKKGFIESMDSLDPSIICLQETKMQQGQADIPLESFHEYWNDAEKKGYSGTAVFSKDKAEKQTNGLNIEHHDNEGRVITLEYDDFYLVNCYTPNSQRGLNRLEYRMEWEQDFRDYLVELDKSKPVILCGDLNVAHQEIDIKNADSNKRNAGFTDEERGKMTALLESGFTDAFRALYPDKEDAYTWWSYFANARERNIGWRLDYFIVSDRFMDKVKDVVIHDQIMGSDHCPVELILKD